MDAPKKRTLDDIAGESHSALQLFNRTAASAKEGWVAGAQSALDNILTLAKEALGYPGGAQQAATFAAEVLSLTCWDNNKLIKAYIDLNLFAGELILESLQKTSVADTKTRLNAYGVIAYCSNHPVHLEKAKNWLRQYIKRTEQNPHSNIAFLASARNWLNTAENRAQPKAGRPTRPKNENSWPYKSKKEIRAG